MSGAYLMKIPANTGSRGEMISSWLTGGTPTHHLHSEYQLATPTTAAWISLGAYRRFTVLPGEVMLVPPGTIHREAALAGGRSEWHILHLPRGMVLGLGRGFRRAAVIQNRHLATRLIDLVASSVVERVGGIEFLERSSELAAMAASLLTPPFRAVEAVHDMNPTALAG